MAQAPTGAGARSVSILRWRRAAVAPLALSVSLFASGTAFALSEIKREELPPVAAPDSGTPAPSGVPLPDPVRPPAEEPAGNGKPTVVQPDVTRPDIAIDEPLPEIVYDVSRLPEPVRRMRELIIEACKSGEIERLRPLLGSGRDVTQLTFGGLESDPIAFLREISGDGEGQEILAILLEVMEAGYVRLNAGEPSELYVWPYFFAVPLDSLDPRQRVELFTLVTAGDYEDMKAFGAYIFYRVGITPEGRWLFFVAGD